MTGVQTCALPISYTPSSSLTLPLPHLHSIFPFFSLSPSLYVPLNLFHFFSLPISLTSLFLYVSLTFSFLISFSYLFFNMSDKMFSPIVFLNNSIFSTIVVNPSDFKSFSKESNLGPRPASTLISPGEKDSNKMKRNGWI